jgi:hypothetical protein
MFSRIIPLILFYSFFIPSEARKQNSNATEIHGTITDAKTKQVVSYAHVKLIGSVAGVTISDPNGKYNIRTVAGVDSVSFSCPGYETSTLAVIQGKAQEINVPLKEVNVRHNHH